MQLLTFARSTTLRWTLLVAALFTGFVVALLGFVYLKTKHDLTIRSDRMIASQMSAFVDLSPERRLDAIDEHLKQDPWRVRLAALFDPNGRRISGNLENLPPDLKTDNAVQGALVGRMDESGSERQAVRLIASGCEWRMRWRSDAVSTKSRDRRWRSVCARWFPLCFFAWVGVVLSAPASIVEVNERVQRIVAGNLRERLPHRNTDDPFSRLAMIVNGMLDEMETLIQSLAGVGSDIAHDLRTPLTRARLILERRRSNARTLEQLQVVADRTTEALDQSLSAITAILRLTEIEKSQRSASFGKVALAELIREVADMYEPIAEDKGMLSDSRNTN
jgi:signal transduction histidine kinase